MILSGWMGRLALPENFQTVFFRQTSHHQFLWHSGQSVRQHSPASHNGCGKLFTHATARIAPCMPANFPGITEGIKSPPTVSGFARLPESPLHTFQATNNPA